MCPTVVERIKGLLSTWPWIRMSSTYKIAISKFQLCVSHTQADIVRRTLNPTFLWPTTYFKHLSSLWRVCVMTLNGVSSSSKISSTNASTQPVWTGSYLDQRRAFSLREATQRASKAAGSSLRSGRAVRFGSSPPWSRAFSVQAVGSSPQRERALSDLARHRLGGEPYTRRETVDSGLVARNWESHSRSCGNFRPYPSVFV